MTEITAPKSPVTAEQFADEIREQLKYTQNVTTEQATPADVYVAASKAVRNHLADSWFKTQADTVNGNTKAVGYLSAEFLMGKQLRNALLNAGLTEQFDKAVEALGFKVQDVVDAEYEPGLGNGGLGRLAACYLDSMTTLDIPAAGYSICYELGIFRQRIVDGQQVELPDNWKDLGGAWLLPKPQETETVCFGGTVRQFWDDGRLHVVPEGETEVLAIPCDMEIAGYGTDHVNTLRLWDAKSPTPLDMSLFSQGEYLRAQEQHAMAETIAKVLYPEDNHPEGKSLRLKQQYFFISASVQRAVLKYKELHGTIHGFQDKVVFQLNDTHPTVAIPELMRILLDEEGLTWEEAWDITTKTCAYTNHTILAEALEKWPRA